MATTQEASRKAASHPPGELVRRLRAELEERLEGITDEERWQRYLAQQARFHRYSFRNTLLIHAQFPGATRVAGKRAWEQLGRRVRAGAEPIWILGPVRAKVRGAEELAPPVGYRWLPVWDVSQTVGEPLASPVVPLEGADDAGILAALSALAEGIGFRIADAVLPDGVYGECSHTERRIRLSMVASGRQRMKTLVHELAHAVAHAEVSERARAELEAESVAWIVMRALGVEAGGYSFGYLAAWAGTPGRARGEVAALAARIQRTATWILDGLGGARGRASAARGPAAADEPAVGFEPTT